MKFHALLLLTATGFAIAHAAQPVLPVVPKPMSVTSQGAGSVDRPTSISSSADFPATAAQLAKQMGLKLEESGSEASVHMVKDARIPSQGYQLDLAPGKITLSASTPAGAFYGGQTLFQLAASGPSLPVCSISDAPRFGWRGLMLDEARHFMGKDYVKHLLDVMALHKMNLFHWHLTDDQGWRVEIKAYPKLTEVGAYRGKGTPLPTPKWDKKKETDPDGPRYGDFYTQEDIREIVAYAAELHIQIMPELDMPGHALAFTTAYPEVLPKQDGDSGEDVHGLKGNVISVAREENYKMLDTIYGELADLFPFPYVHIGGDEVNVNSWKTSPEHRTMMETKGFKNPHQLQNHFMLRLEKILKGHDKTMLGWNEIMHGGQLSKDTGVMAWISVGAGLNAARAGHPTIMAVGPHCYFDMKYPGPGETGHWWAGIVDTRNAYDWNPVFEGQLKPEEQKRIQGVHCALWTEFVHDTAKADYQLWPRACATAEVGWTPQSDRNWDDFNLRLGKHFDRLDDMKVGFRVPPPSATMAKGLISIVPAHPAAVTIFTTDGSKPTVKSPVHKAGDTLPVSDLNGLRYRTLRSNGRMSKVAQGATREPIAILDARVLPTLPKPTTIDLQNIIDQKGSWILELKHSGNDPVEIGPIRLYSGGKVLAELETLTLSKEARRKQLRLKLDTFTAGSDYQLRIPAKSPGDKARVSITFDRSPWIEPAGATVTTDLPGYGSSTPEKLTDWDRSSFHWVGRKGAKGDQWVIQFADPVTVKELAVPTGKPNSNDDIIQRGRLEISADGKTFKPAAKFELGTARATFAGPTRIQAIRITIDSDQESWVIVRDPEMK